MQFDSNQVAVFNEVKNGKGHVAILATAGSGKTTTILEALKYVPYGSPTVFLSFSKAIVDELIPRVPSGVEAKTLHSIGFAMLRAYYPRTKFEVDKLGDKYTNLALAEIKKTKKVLDYKKDFRKAKLVNSVCTYARMTMTPHTKEELSEMCMYYNVDFDEQIIDISLDLLKDSLKINNKGTTKIDFTDMIYFPAAKPKMIQTKYKYIFLDEAQDTNRAQFIMVETLLAPKGRLISVGDDYQCIYGFSGADIDAFKRIRDRENTVTLPLSVSYRCPKKAVERAQEIDPTMQAWDNAAEGEERQGSWTEIREGDMVLSRTNKPLIELYFNLVDMDIKTCIVGKDIENGLIDLAESCMSTTKEGIVKNAELKLSALEMELRTKGHMKPHDHPLYRSLLERIQVLHIILRKIQLPSELMNQIKKIFADDKKAARLMTIHRSKGLENDRVFVIEEAGGQKLMPSKWAQQPWEHKQERNLMFVSRTRCKKSLIFINLND